MNAALFWIAFNLIVLAILFIDLRFIHRDAHVASMKEVTLWLLFLVALAMGFCVGIYFFKGHHKALQFLTGYIVELSLSVDNLFVFLMIFNYFSVPKIYQPRVLHWGILGAIVMRFILIFAGTSLVTRFHWIIYIFGLMLVFTGIRMALKKDEDKEFDPEKNPLVRLSRKFMPVASRGFVDQKFFVKLDGIWHLTPLFLVILVIESSDLVFAVDSIPAVFAITTDFFIVYTSNVFAILGLRALFFALSHLVPLFVYLKQGISIVLCFVGVKMLISGTPYRIPTVASLGVIVAILGGSVLLSILHKRKEVGSQP